MLWAALAGSIGNASGYRVENAFDGVAFDAPIEITFAPGFPERVYVVERPGRVAVIRNREQPEREILLDITTLLGETADDHGLHSAAFHPDFEHNGRMYLWYSVPLAGGERGFRLAEFTVEDPVNGTGSPDSEKPLITRHTAYGSHDGGQLFFGSDGYLYLSIGDGDAHLNATTRSSQQSVNGDFFGMVIRIDVDQRPENLAPNPHPSVHAGSYRVPADNPFVGVDMYHGEALDPSSVRTEIFALGLRNPFRMSYDATTDQIWLADVGLDTVEELNLVSAGGNYGWPWLEGTIQGPYARPADVTVNLLPPVWSYGHDWGESITGGVVYRGSKFPELDGAYVAADLLSGRIWAIFDDGRRPLPAEAAVEITNDDFVVDFANDNWTGDLLICDLTGGSLKRLARDFDMPNGLINLSSRASVGSGEHALIPGFVIRGGAKQVLVRGIGPALAEEPFNLNHTANAPQIKLMRDGEVWEQNQGWFTAPNAAAIRVAAGVAGAFPLEEASADSALLVTLPEGAYTVVTEETDGTPGVGLVEVYDLDDSKSSARLVNLGLRAESGNGSETLTMGFVITGDTSSQVLIRGIGPGLESHGIAAPLSNPALILFQEDRIIASNSNWQDSPQAAAIKLAETTTGAFPLTVGASDTALLLELDPGVYTAQLNSVSNSDGIALIEIYAIP